MRSRENLKRKEESKRKERYANNNMMRKIII
jgi:hypothetical protein